MKLAVASGKGGTGKTTVSSSLVTVWPNDVLAVDLDVEAPNLHLFLHPEITGSHTAGMEIPEVDESRCDRCRACSDICQFKAISVLGEVVMVFPEMCHGCGACREVCPRDAIRPASRKLGTVLWGHAGRASFLAGRLRIGEAMSPPLMRAVKSRLEKMAAPGNADVVIDAPPGVSCPAVNAVMDADAILLVTEPTPFGLYDLRLARDAFNQLQKPMGVVINRSGIGNDGVYDYCRKAQLPILATIPYDRQIAEGYASGRVIATTSPELWALFQSLAEKTMALAENRSPVLEAC